jgi:hypothetical protein
MTKAEALAQALLGRHITVQVKYEYGTRRIYPLCDAARLFARIAGSKTLSRENIERIKMLGFRVEGTGEAP